MGVQFLSDEWASAVQEALNTNAAFKSAAGSLAARIQQVVTTDDGEKRYWFVISNGEASLGTGDIEGAPDATITQDYATAEALSKNELTGVAAYMSGKLRVQGDMMKLMQLLGPLAQMPAALAGIDVDYS
jgi:putative sterol carrier protein